MQQSQQDPQLSPQQKKLISYTVKDIVVEEAPCFPIKQVTLSIKIIMTINIRLKISPIY
jgi:hemolysin activation/secretion protein